MYLFVSSGLRNINGELIEAALVSGSSSTAVFFKVTLPLLRPVLLYGGGVALLLGLGQFTAPLLLGRNAGIDVLTTDMYRSVSQSPIDYSVAAAIGSPLILIGLRRRPRPAASRSVISAASSPTAGGAFHVQQRPSKLASAYLVIYGLLSTGAARRGADRRGPVAVLERGVPRGASSGCRTSGAIFEEARDHRSDLDEPDRCRSWPWRSPCPSASSASKVLLGRRTPRWLRTGPRPHRHAAPRHPGGRVRRRLPPAVHTASRWILYGSRWVVILVYVTLMLPFTDAHADVGDARRSATRTSRRRGPAAPASLRTDLKILLPLLRPTLGGAAALMFVLLTHEFAASLLVRSSTMQVMGTVLYDYWTNGSYPLVAAIALVMTGVTADRGHRSPCSSAAPTPSASSDAVGRLDEMEMR